MREYEKPTQTHTHTKKKRVRLLIYHRLSIVKRSRVTGRCQPICNGYGRRNGANQINKTKSKRQTMSLDSGEEAEKKHECQISQTHSVAKYVRRQQSEWVEKNSRRVYKL